MKQKAFVDKLLEVFLEEYINLYGITSIHSNVHNICHLAGDLENFDNLRNVGTDEFENQLGIIKTKIRSCNKPLEQLVKRIAEISYVRNSETENDDILDNSIIQWDVNNNFIDRNDTREKYKSLQCKSVANNFVLSNKNCADKWFLTKDKKIVEFQYAFKKNNEIFIVGKTMKNMHSFFAIPVTSSLVNIFVGKIELLSLKIYSVNDIKCKMISLPYESNFVFMPLIHTNL